MASDETDGKERRQSGRAISRWENEGGSTCSDGVETTGPGATSSGEPPLTKAELIQLRIRVIALENLVIALLAGAPRSQRETVIDMAAFISPRPGHIPHPITLHAATQMLSLVERSELFVADAQPRAHVKPEPGSGPD